MFTVSFLVCLQYRSEYVYSIVLGMFTVSFNQLLPLVLIMNRTMSLLRANSNVLYITLPFREMNLLLLLQICSSTVIKSWDGEPNFYDWRDTDGSYFCGCRLWWSVSFVFLLPFVVICELCFPLTGPVLHPLTSGHLQEGSTSPPHLHHFWTDLQLYH